MKDLLDRYNKFQAARRRAKAKKRLHKHDKKEDGAKYFRLMGDQK